MSNSVVWIRTALPLPVSQSIEYFPASVFIGEKLGTSAVMSPLQKPQPKPAGCIKTL